MIFLNIPFLILLSYGIILHGEYKGIIDIKSLKMLEGDLPRRALNLIIDWAVLHQNELLADWDLCTQKQMPNKIEPLK